LKWVKDKSGRFSQRPHYLPSELDEECESLIKQFLTKRQGRVIYPLATDDLAVLIETLVDDLDLYADLSAETGEVEGVTDFFVERRPTVRISNRLSEPRMSNRLRTTLTHELGHVKFHTFMFATDTVPQSLFESGQIVLSNRCKRDDIFRAGKSDWMEWQAGYACGSFLMPFTALRESVRAFATAQNATMLRFDANTSEGEDLITSVVEKFQVSRDAARVRLLQRMYLSEGHTAPILF
jgi:Zn-dependent peptidase ImmA (M78 family)